MLTTDVSPRDVFKKMLSLGKKDATYWLTKSNYNLLIYIGAVHNLHLYTRQIRSYFMLQNTLPPKTTVDQEVEWYKAELGTWDNLDKAWDPAFKAEFKRLSGAAIQTIILGSGKHWNLDIGPDAFGMAGAYQRLITTEQLSAMNSFMIRIIYPSIVLSNDIDFSKLGYFHIYELASNLDTSLAADDPQAMWVSKITLEQVSKLNTADGYPCQANLYTFWTNPKNLSTDADVALPYLESLREKLQAIGGRAIAIAMGYYYDQGEFFALTDIDPRVSQLLTTNQTNDSFQYFIGSSEGVKRWLGQNFKDIATLKRKDVVIQDLSSDVVKAMAVELDRTSQVNGEFGYWVWQLSDQQIKGLSNEAGFALFKAWVSHDWLDETYSPNHVVNDTLARQFKNFNSIVIENIIRTNFGLAAKYQWLLTAEQVNGLSPGSLSKIFGTIAQRTDLTSGLSQRVVDVMANMLGARGQVNGQLGYWVWTLSDQQVKGLSNEAGFALFKAWVSQDWLDQTYSPNEVVNDTLARQVKNFRSDVIDTIIKTDFGLAAKYQWLLSAEQVNGLASKSISAIGLTIKSKFSYGELSKNVWDVLGVTAEPVLVEQHINDALMQQPTVNAELLIQRMASVANEPSANTNVFNPNAPLGAFSSNQALVAVH